MDSRDDNNKNRWPFNLRSLDDLAALAGSLSVEIPAIADVSILSQPVKVGSLSAPNSLAVHPMEGCDGDAQGRPGKLTIRRYERFAAGGAGLLWSEAIAVVPEGRANPRQLWFNPGSLPAIRGMVARMRQVAAQVNGANHRPIIVAQLTHSGRYSKPEGKAHPLIAAHDPYRDARIVLPDRPPGLPADWPVLTDDYLDRLADSFVVAARIAFEAGFDAVDVKCCHGYLLNELVGAHTRPGKYGGSFENRARLMLAVVDRIREALGPDKPIVSRLGVYDAIPYPYGWGVDKGDWTKPDLAEPLALVNLLRQRGVPMINITVGNPYYEPYINRPFNEPVAGGNRSPEHPLVGVARLIGLTGQVQRANPQVAVVGTGFSWLRTWMANVGAAVKAGGLATFIGAGRMAFAYPDFAADIVRKGRMDPRKVCVGCSGCTQMMRDGGVAGCVVRDNKVYGPLFRRGRRGNRDNLVRLAQSCRQCRQATCSVGCPAGVDIPRFIRLFLDGDDRGAYEVIRQANVFGEVCSHLCPVESQCQGHCLESFIGDGALPIADIQRYLCEQANARGWSRLRLPAQASGRKVAVIGAGPAGLACAARLLECGHAVTVFDRATELGGMVRATIPADRVGGALAKEVAAIFRDLPTERFAFHGGWELTETRNLDAIFKDGFDAVFLGLGLWRVAVGTPSTHAARVDGVMDALEFLARVKHGGELEIAGKTLAVVGGGSTAMDVAVTARELGAEVYLLYRRSFSEMPAWKAERDRAMEIGVHFLILTGVLDYRIKSGKLTGLTLCPTRLGEADSDGRRKPVAVKDSPYNFAADFVVEAIGQESPSNLERLLPGVKLSDGLIQTAGDGNRTGRQRVYAGGDIVRGASTVVAAVADGMRAANEIDEDVRMSKA